MTIAEYKNQFDNRQITINRDYQRSSGVWPPAARSNLIDTIVNGYPIPKILLSQTTDLDTLQSRKEVVDGQQRTSAILDFLNDSYALTRGSLKGRRFQGLDADARRAILDYVLSVDVFSSATDEDIREVFRRINSFQIPLNGQEKRHATFQGEFKDFIQDMGRKYASALVKLGLVTERQISRMMDLEYIADLAHLIIKGIKTRTPTVLNKLYKEFDQEFEHRNFVEKELDEGLGTIIELPEILGTRVMSREGVYSLIAAKFALVRLPALVGEPFVRDKASPQPRETILANITVLNEALESNLNDHRELGEFVRASAAATNTETHRRIRAKWFYWALTEPQR
jgi:hypothetical protein